MVRGNTAMRAREVRDAFERGQREAYDFGWRTGKKAGIKEVMEWMEKRNTMAKSVGYLGIEYKEWEAQKKKWGIDG